MGIAVFSKDSIDSTNEWAKRILKKRPELLQDGFITTAESQSKGKGTKGRVWYSDCSGGLYYSLAICPQYFDFNAIEFYHQQIAEAIQLVLTQLAHIDVTIKYPNDIYLNHKKLGGILMESSMKANQDRKLDYLIIGIGLNINQSAFPDALTHTATSVYLETRNTLDKLKLIKPLTRHLTAIFSL